MVNWNATFIDNEWLFRLVSEAHNVRNGCWRVGVLSASLLPTDAPVWVVDEERRASSFHLHHQRTAAGAPIHCYTTRSSRAATSTVYTR